MANRCDECGFDWSISVDDSNALIAGAPARYASLLEGRDGSSAPTPGVWSPVAYVWHVVDVMRIGADRIWAARSDGSAVIVPYEQDELAAVRGYSALPQGSAVWALGRAAGDWSAASESADHGTPFRHPEMPAGTTLADHARRIAHEVHHHDLDIRRGLGVA